MFSDNHNLIKNSDSFYIYSVYFKESVYFEEDNHYKVFLMTKGIEDLKETKALIDCVSEKIIHQHRNYIKIYKSDSYLVKSYPIYNIYLVDDELTIYFRMPSTENNEVNFEKMYDWSVLIFNNQEADGRYIYGSSLIN